MMTPVRKQNRSIWNTIRVQIGGCLIVGGLLPALLRALTVTDPRVLPLIGTTLIGVALAIVFAGWLIRHVQTYPGAEATSFIPPSFFLSFGMLLVILLFARIPYSLSLLSAAFVISLIWYFLAAIMAQRERMPTIGILPFGDFAPLLGIDRVNWVMLETPDADVGMLDAVAADLRIDLPSAWDRRLADYALDGLPVYHVKHLRESLTGRVELEHLSENSFGALMPRPDYMAAKHVVDWIAALLVGVAALPVMILVAIAVRFSSPGPILFRQERVGYQGRPFTVLKFRTMRVAGDGPRGDDLEAAITRAGDPRITPVGRFLRTSRLDELPQLINVLRGEMSWIGPRPEAAVLSRWYETEIPFYRYRHIVRPGIAGWAQVCQGHVADVSEVREKLHFDFYYIKQYSPWIDLLIVVRTVKTMITGYGSR